MPNLFQRAVCSAGLFQLCGELHIHAVCSYAAHAIESQEHTRARVIFLGGILSPLKSRCRIPTHAPPRFMAASQFQHRLRVSAFGSGLEWLKIFRRNENQFLSNGGWKIVGGQWFELGRRGKLRNIPGTQHAHFDSVL